MNEHRIAAELWIWRNYHIRIYPCLELFHHVANEGKRNALKTYREGMLAGLPDYHMPVGCAQYHSFWIELKSAGKKPTQKQIDILERLISWGNYAVWVDNLQDAINEVQDYCKWVHGR